IALSVSDSNGVYIVPAFVGIGAPYWNMYARGTVFGLTRGAKREHFVRATLESLAYQTMDVLKSMEEDSNIKLCELNVDGGATANNFLMQFQSDILSVPVNRPRIIETTVLGAAYLAGLAVGFWKDKEDILRNKKISRSFKPSMDEAYKNKLIKGWKRAVKASLYWAEDKE
ncbi:MAG: FGGY-family carbohydrate kinase, partial [Caloramator sp.]|nr:FGGY-family carbohydrate kinase [Caloramator sp.]